ncbi:3-oxoacyl-ACP synthase [Candidatus Magnetoovum chiemensis]|nr:3-oxoacyl-ACP synthase [Candidatus Magnetoovum chiemensis]
MSENAHVYDAANACLGAVTGMVNIANAIELGQIKAGLVVSCETARQIVDSTIDEINQAESVEFYKNTIATMTGGSGAVGIVMTDGTLGNSSSNNSGDNVDGSAVGNSSTSIIGLPRKIRRHQLIGGVVKQATQFHKLCQWKFSESGMPTTSKVVMRTNAHGVLENGLVIAEAAYKAFIEQGLFPNRHPDKFICHQVGSTHQQMVQKTLNIDPKKDFSTYQYLGNIGTVSLPITAAIADECGFLMPDDNVGFMGIDSGLNCIILGIKW